MTLQEVREKIKVDDYGTIVIINRYGYHINPTGTVVFISKKGTVVFYGHDKEEYFLSPERIEDFIPKEMLPAPTKHKGKDVSFDGGRWIYTKTGREAYIDR